MPTDLGTIYTTGTSFRARAETQARRWRAANNLEPGRYGHLLTREDAEKGRNFATTGVFDALRKRHNQGKDKGVGWERSTDNLLASQAMCFNIFAPLAAARQEHLDATKILQTCWPGIKDITEIRLEYTPRNNPLGDQSAKAGVDADVRIDFRHQDGRRGILLIETKFVEPDFSHCGYRKPGRPHPCPEGTIVDVRGSNCSYSTRKPKPYRYWEQSIRLGVVNMERIGSGPCPFGGGLWQPWLNYTLAKALADEESAVNPADPVTHAWYAVVAPRANEALHQHVRPDVISALGNLVHCPQDLSLVAVEDLIVAIGNVVAGQKDHAKWFEFLKDRYAVRPPT